MSIAAALTRTIAGAVRLDAARVEFSGEGALRSTFAVTDFVSAAVGAAGLATADLVAALGASPPPVAVDRRLASLWCGNSLRPLGWSLPPAWDDLAGDYAARDGFIRLHTNAPHHRAVAERVLGAHDKTAAQAAVANWEAQALETAIVDAGGCAAAMHSVAAWSAHPQGIAVAAEPLVHQEPAATAPDNSAWGGSPARPLAGLRVLDLTRVLAGPVASRFLAGLGAEVLRLDPPDWSEQAVEPQVTLGKRCARLDLKEPRGRATFEALLARAHVFLNGYRPDALARLGYGPAARRALAPGLVDVCLDAYGWRGPWAGRRGFDSLVQMSTGIAEAGMRWKKADEPVPLPVQALDHATGYLIAATALRGLAERLRGGAGLAARVSLARMAKVLVDAGAGHEAPPLAPAADADFDPAVEHTSWGEALRLRPPLTIPGTPLYWELPACRLGSHPPAWR